MQKMRKMKDSGIEWIGEIPEGWEVATIGHLFSVTAGGDAKPHLYSYVQDAKHPYPVYTNSSNPNQIYAYTSAPKFNENTITVTGRGDIGHAFYRNTKFDAIIRLLVLAPKSALDCRYYAYWIDNVSIFFTNSAAVGQLSAQQIFPYKTCYLPLCEQQSIANHLDFYCSEIEHILADIQNSIQEYKKLKQAVITQAVTKGVRGEREMKDSGVAWIGKIPTTYSICKLKYLLKNPLKYGANESGIPYSDSLPRYIRITDITPDGNLKCTGKLSLSEESAKDYILEDGDILFARSGATVGKTFIYYQSYGRSAYAGYLIKASLNNKVSPKFVYYYTCSSLYEIWKNSIFIQSTIQNIGADRYANLPVPVPKTLQEQEEIADYLDAKCAEIDKLIAKKEQLVKELESYKKSLIYEVVTGKREV